MFERCLEDDSLRPGPMRDTEPFSVVPRRHSCWLRPVRVLHPQGHLLFSYKFGIRASRLDILATVMRRRTSLSCATFPSWSATFLRITCTFSLSASECTCDVYIIPSMMACPHDLVSVHCTADQMSIKRPRPPQIPPAFWEINRQATPTPIARSPAINLP